MKTSGGQLTKTCPFGHSLTGRPWTCRHDCALWDGLEGCCSLVSLVREVQQIRQTLAVEVELAVSEAVTSATLKAKEYSDGKKGERPSP